MPRRRVVAIINPSTRGDAARLEAMLRAEADSATDLVLHRTAGPGHATRLARDAAARETIVVAVGGDGTVADVATGIAGSAALLGIVPAGSTNITAKELGLPASPRLATRVIFGPHRVRSLDVGVADGRRFLHMAGAGLDSHFFQRTSRALKRRVGWLAYLPAATIALRQPPAAFTITVDDQSLATVSPLVVVANGASIITPVFKIYPGIVTDDGWLDVLVFTAVTPVAIGQTVAAFATRSLGQSPHVVRMRGKRVTLAANPVLPVQFDGDVMTATPVQIGIESGALRVVVPLQPRSG